MNFDLDQVINGLSKTFFGLPRAGKMGIGVYAWRKVFKGERIAHEIFTPEAVTVVNSAEFMAKAPPTLGKWVKAHFGDDGTDETIVIPCSFFTGVEPRANLQWFLMWFVNASKTPNLIYGTDGKSEWFEAAHDIEPGEELTWNYTPKMCGEESW